MSDDWVLIKRGLFWRPNSCGYTGIRDEAGRYPKEVADEYAAAGGKVMLAADAPEFMPAAYSDLVLKHLTGQRDTLVRALFVAAERLEARGHKLGAREARAVLGDVGNAGSGS